MTTIKEIDSTVIEQIITKLEEQLLEQYVFSEVAEKMAIELRKNLREGLYSDIGNIEDFCEKVTRDLYAICRDKHLKVIYRPEVVPSESKGIIDKIVEEERRRGKVENYGFYRAERLPGNIGYIDMRRFYGIDIGSETAINTMAMIKNTDALIFDLRKNGGGRIDMVAFLTSYFLEEPTHINTIYNRAENSSIQTWTQKYVPGSRYFNKPIFILTSNYTFSGAEAFTYSLQNLKLAKVIGEVTGGGANPVIFTQVTDYIRFKIPNRRTICPITNSNWEGTGIIPDVLINKEDAFKYAYKEALLQVREKYNNNSTYSSLLREIDLELESLG
jgi:C-terminal processing protease CtpA/Prc